MNDTEPIPFTANALDTVLYVLMAMNGAALTLVAAHQLPSYLIAPLGIAGAGLHAWKTKRSKGTADAKAGDPPPQGG